jgi:hypothetical protein
MKKFLVEAVEELFYRKIVEAENEDEAYEVFYETTNNKDVVEARMEVTRTVEVKDEDQHTT